MITEFTNRLFALVLLVWTISCAVMGWNIGRMESEIVSHLLEDQGNAYVETVFLIQNWNLSHGTVYVPSGRQLTLVTPGAMAHHFFIAGRAQLGFTTHFVSLSPLQPHDIPDAWERRALAALARGGDQFAQRAVFEGVESFRIMRPLPPGNGCLRCHVEEKARGNARSGAISVSFSAAHVLKEQQQFLWLHRLVSALAWLLGLWLLLLGRRGVLYRSQALQESQEKFSAVFQRAPVLMIVSSVESGLCLDVNTHFLNAFGLAREAAVGLPMSELGWFSPEDWDAVVRRVLGQGGVTDMEFEIRARDGRRISLLYSAALVMIRKRPHILSLALDITRRKQAEAHLQETLREKETLLREVHHRVKNNLQSIIHLIDMRLSSGSESGAESFLMDLQGQARTMALVYEQLSNSENLARIDMDSYLKTLATSVVSSFGRGREISVEVEEGKAALGIEQAMPCGLVVNELVTNALKHAFPLESHASGRITLSIREERGRVRLRVADDGAGLPPGVDVLQGDSLGLKLVRLWAEHQLGGTLFVERRAGASFLLEFPLAES